jgi:hypothetical protein
MTGWRLSVVSGEARSLASRTREPTGDRILPVGAEIDAWSFVSSSWPGLSPLNSPSFERRSGELPHGRLGLRKQATLNTEDTKNHEEPRRRQNGASRMPDARHQAIGAFTRALARECLSAIGSSRAWPKMASREAPFCLLREPPWFFASSVLSLACLATCQSSGRSGWARAAGLVRASYSAAGAATGRPDDLPIKSGEGHDGNDVSASRRAGPQGLP